MKRRSKTDAVSPPNVDLRALHRGPEDDFFCQRYKVWYPSFDCAVRTRFRTADGCLHCDQGRFNERRHATALSLGRFHLPDLHASEDEAAEPADESGKSSCRRDR